MSAISSVTSGSQAALLQQLQQNGGTGSSSRADFQKQRQADITSALEQAGVDPSKVGDIQQQISAAVQNVRQNGSTGTDQQSAIKDAVNSVLHQNGVDVTKFQDALKTAHAGHAHRGGKAGGGGKGDSDGDNDSSGSSTSSVTDTSQANQQFTINSKIADLLKSLSAGTTQQSQVSDLPAGSLVDVAA